MKKFFYKITYETSEPLPNGFAWGQSLGPLPGGMPFFHPAQLERNKEFWKVNPSPPGLWISDRAWRWPDILGYGGGNLSFFVSRRVVESLRTFTSGVSRVTEVPIYRIDALLLKIIPPPKYFVIETEAGIELDWAASGYPVDVEGKLIRGTGPERGAWPKLKHNTWNGTDLFAYSTVIGPPYTTLICTEKITYVAANEGWTNVRFQPIEAI
jgi:hypothetical protein